MNNNQKEILVYADWDKAQPPELIGTLFASLSRGKEVFSFEYSKNWLNYNISTILDPDLKLFTGPQYLSNNKNNFGMFLDSSPDRWGRMLMRRREAVLAREEDRPERQLLESDYLLGVCDKQRIGGLRFKTKENELFLNDNKSLAIPPGSSLGGARPKAGILDSKNNLWIAKFPSLNDDVRLSRWSK